VVQLVFVASLSDVLLRPKKQVKECPRSEISFVEAQDLSQEQFGLNRDRIVKIRNFASDKYLNLVVACIKYIKYYINNFIKMVKREMSANLFYS